VLIQLCLLIYILGVYGENMNLDKTHKGKGGKIQFPFCWAVFQSIQHVHGEMEPDDENHYLVLL